MKHLFTYVLTALAWMFVGVGSFAVGIDDLYRLDQLPQFKSSTYVGSVSSYDRTGGNDDGFSGTYSFVRKDADGLVLADLKGPGVIYRIWTPTPTDDVMEFFFDGEATPRISVKFRDLFLGKNPLFPSPLCGFGAGGYYCYVPLPYAKSCVIRIRAPKMQFYQINYAQYNPGTPITTFDAKTFVANPGLTKACDAFRNPGTHLTAFTTPPGAQIKTIATKTVIPPHSSKPIFSIRKGGRITGMRLTPSSVMAGKARDLTIKISFDGQAPAVICPIGDFFGYAWGQPATKSIFIGTVGETNYCYFPMPFHKSARVEIVSERNAPVDIHAEFDFSPVPQKSDEGQFYALWRRENPTTKGKPYTFINTKGHGHLVGVALQSQGLEPGQTLFFEGDDETTLDGELTIHGTGSEDFFNGGWYDVPDRWEKRLSFPLSGCLEYSKHLGRTGAYRFFVGDTYAFHKSLLQTIEHSGEKNQIPTDYCSVSYLYLEKRPTADMTLPPLKDRAVADPTEIKFPAWWQLPIHAWSFSNAKLVRKNVKVNGGDVNCLSLTGTGGDWFGPHFISPVCDVPASGKYAIYIEAVKGPEQGILQLFKNENPVSDPVDLYSPNLVRSGRLAMGTLDLQEGKNNLMFKLVGKNGKSKALSLDLIEIICVKEK